MTTRTRKLANHTHLNVITELLLSIRSEDRYDGLYEAADLQWWWRDGDWANPDLQMYWFDHLERPIASFLKYDTGKRWECDCFWLPSARTIVEEEVWPVVLSELDALTSEKSVQLTVDERDDSWRNTIESAGWHYSGASSFQMVQEPVKPPSPIALPGGFTIHDETHRDCAEPHPLSKRNGPEIVERLNECSLYNPELDLVIRNGDGAVASYCICWIDPRNSVGLFEPVRTEDEFQRRGLGRILMTEGVIRMMALHAQCIKVTHHCENIAAQALYESVGFRPLFRKCEYILKPETNLQRIAQAS